MKKLGDQTIVVTKLYTSPIRVDLTLLDLRSNQQFNVTFVPSVDGEYLNMLKDDFKLNVKDYGEDS